MVGTINQSESCMEVCGGAWRYAEGCMEVCGGAQRCMEVCGGLCRGAQRCAEVCAEGCAEVLIDLFWLLRGFSKRWWGKKSGFYVN